MIWLKVFKKETAEQFRDKRVRFGAFIMPALLIYLIFSLISFMTKSVESQKGSIILFVSGGERSALAKALQDKGSKIKTVDSFEHGRKMVQDGDAKLIVEAPTADASGQTKVRVVHDSTEPMSQIQLNSVEESITDMNEKQAKARLEALNVDPKVLQTVELKPIDVAKKEAQGASGLASFLPYFIILWAFSGGMSAVADMAAGEKERGTMETLLIAPVRRSDIALGKFWSLALICLASTASALVGVGVSAVSFAGSGMFEGGSLKLPVTSIFAILVTLLPLVMFFAALLLAVSAWAKNMREAQTYLAIVNFVVLIPAVFSNLLGFMDVTKTMWIKFTPILSNSMVIRSALLGKPDWTTAFISAGVGIVLAAIGLSVVVKLFNREEILIRS